MLWPAIQPWVEDEERMVAAMLAEDKRRWNIDHGLPEDWDSSSEYEILNYESSEDGERDYIIQDDVPNFD